MTGHDHNHDPVDPNRHGDVGRAEIDPDAPLRTRVAEVCMCGTVLRVNIAAGQRAVRQAIARFQDNHTGPGHGPGELLIDRRQ